MDANKFYILEKNNWIETKIKPENISFHWIKLYDDEFNFKGIGMYKKQTL